MNSVSKSTGQTTIYSTWNKAMIARGMFYLSQSAGGEVANAKKNRRVLISVFLE